MPPPPRIMIKSGGLLILACLTEKLYQVQKGADVKANRIKIR